MIHTVQWQRDVWFYRLIYRHATQLASCVTIEITTETKFGFGSRRDFYNPRQVRDNYDKTCFYKKGLLVITQMGVGASFED